MWRIPRSANITREPYERAGWNNGAFTKSVLEGLSGGADFKSVGKITVNMLDAFISERMGGAPDHPMTVAFPEGEYLKGLVLVKRVGG